MDLDKVMADKIWGYMLIARSEGFSAYEGTEHLLRVLKTRYVLGNNHPNTEELYNVMTEHTKELGRFRGDAKFFEKIYEALCDITPRGILFFLKNSNERSKDYFLVPDVLIEKLGEYITPETKKVFVPECEQYGSALLDIVEAHPEIKFTLGGVHNTLLQIFSYVYSNCKNVEFIAADIYRENFNTSKYDLIICIPIFGMRRDYESPEFICRESDLIAVQNLLYHVELEGRLVIIIPARITFGGGRVALLREYLQTNYSIKEISILPAALFFPFSGIKTYLFCIGNGNTEDVLIRKYDAPRPTRKNNECTELNLVGEEILFPDEFTNLNGWNVEMAFAQEDDDLKAYSLTQTKKLALQETATLFRGKSVAEKTENGKYGVINISNLTEVGIDYSNLDLLDEEERKVSKYLLETGDVLVTCRGTAVKIAVFKEQGMPCIPSSNIVVIRPNQFLQGEFLKIFLESPVGVKLLKSLQRGTIIMNLNPKDLGTLEVPILPIELQNSIISEYQEGLNLYQQTIAAANEAWSKAKKDIQSKLF